jgi:Iap family predicted aminopeptidase
MNHAGILPYIASACYPDWLQGVVADAASQLGVATRERSLMSDHCTFAQAGIPAISIQSGKHRIHSEADTVDALVPATVDAGARLAAAIVWQLELRLAGGAVEPVRGEGRDSLAQAR